MDAKEGLGTQLGTMLSAQTAVTFLLSHLWAIQTLPLTLGKSQHPQWTFRGGSSSSVEGGLS